GALPSCLAQLREQGVGLVRPCEPKLADVADGRTHERGHLGSHPRRRRTAAIKVVNSSLLTSAANERNTAANTPAAVTPGKIRKSGPVPKSGVLTCAHSAAATPAGTAASHVRPAESAISPTHTRSKRRRSSVQSSSIWAVLAMATARLTPMWPRASRSQTAEPKKIKKSIVATRTGVLVSPSA